MQSILAAQVLQNALRSRKTNTSLFVFCESEPLDVEPTNRFHLDNISKIKIRSELYTPRRLPDVLSPPPVEKLKSDKQTQVETYTVATPRPSNWPYHCALQQLNSNTPVEDRGVVSLLNVKKQFLDEAEAGTAQKPWLLAAVIDGHGGWQTSEYVSKVLTQRILKCINETSEQYLTADTVARQLTECFARIDKDLKRRVEPAFDLGHSKVIRAGATTCIGLITPSKIIAANIGDCRAILSRNGKPIILAEEHNAGNPEEARKLREAHPNEEDVIVVKSHSDNGKKITDPNPNPLLRLATHLRLGDFNVERARRPASYVKHRLQLTRSFGDFDLKEAKFAVNWDTGRATVKPPHSHPYISALPEVTVVERNHTQDEFLIIASDGVWDEMTPEEGIAIVGRELDAGSDAAKAAIKLQNAVLERAAFRKEMDVEEILAKDPRERRGIYDDLTIAVVCLDEKHTCVPE